MPEPKTAPSMPRVESPTHLWVEEGEAAHGPVARVAMIAPVEPSGDGYSYTVPADLADALRPGQRIEVPFGRKNRLRIGFCIDISEGEWTSTLKPIHAILDPIPHVDANLLRLARWIADYYACSLGWTLAAMVPDAVRRGAGTRVVRDVSLARPLDEILSNTPAPAETGKPGHRTRIGPKHRALLESLSRAARPVRMEDVRRNVGCTAALVRKAEQRGHVHVVERREPLPGPDFDRPCVEPSYTLNEDQSAAARRLDAIIEAGDFRVALLHGVSGSGKTEVYIHAMRRVIAAGRQAILLVPEIALTAQTVARLSARFERVAVIHSGLSGRDRARVWTDVATGRKSVIIGTRSAVFAPCPNLGLIVVDEEQEPSYKNLRSPRYHTRDVAIMRGHLGEFPVVLGSATPSLETWSNARRLSHYESIELPRRVTDLPLPAVELIDMRVEQRARPGMHLLSRRMEEELRGVHERGEQAVLLLNRRGYASYVFCPSCKQAIVCQNCSANLVFHKASGRATGTNAEMCVCHYCHARVPVPTRCSDTTCGHTLMRFGMGTQRVEEELSVKIPGLRVARVDSDTMTKARDYEAVVADFEARRVDALVGTQMIAKGLDFPFVSFVGVISADAALAIPDFRAAERTFQLVVQVAGRSGRADRAGKVIVQSFAPEAPALQSAVCQDYNRFAEREIENRRRLSFPPFTRLARVILADAREARVRDESAGLATRLRESLEAGSLDGACLGPRPCPLPRLRGLYRYDLLIRAAGSGALRKILERARTESVLTARVKQLTIDVDPVSLL